MQSWERFVDVGRELDKEARAMRVMHPSREELEDRRRRLIERAGFSSRREFAERARRGALSGEELWLWEDVKSIDFLLAEDPDASVAVDGGG